MSPRVLLSSALRRRLGINGVVLYSGPSRIDGAPIVVILTGLTEASENDKTGKMLQTWIIRADRSPGSAVHSRTDYSVCGNCPHRGRFEGGRNRGRTCYVLEFQAPTSVYEALQRGRYPVVDLATARELCSGRSVRVGSYGDPYAVPVRVWRAVLARARHWTGYTHQWRKIGRRRNFLRSVLMASVDSEAEAIEAQRLGWRTFHVTSTPEPGAVLCPASEEAGKRTTCERCGLCQGASKAAKSVYIPPHGSRAKALRRLKVVAQ